MAGFSGRLLFACANPHVLLARLWYCLLLLLKQGPKSGAAASAPGLALPSRSRCHCHSFSSGGDSSRKTFSSLHLADQFCSIPSPSPEGAANQEGHRCREAAGLLYPAGLEGLRVWDGDEWEVSLWSLEKSRKGSWEKRHGRICGWGGEEKSDHEVLLPW